MELATQYARALYATKNPDLGLVRQALERRGHIKLLPRIVHEYEKLQLGAQRRARMSTITPEQEQTRTLLELYQKLISTK